MIPTVCWSDDLSFEFCFDGIPKESIVAVANTGCVHGKYQSELFKIGYYEMLDRLNPTKVLFFGQIPEYLSDEENIVSIGNSHERFNKLESYTENEQKDV